MSAEKGDTGNGGGYGNPPRSGRFEKGVPASPAGRPKGSKRLPPFEDNLPLRGPVRAQLVSDHNAWRSSLLL